MNAARLGFLVPGSRLDSQVYRDVRIKLRFSLWLYGDLSVRYVAAKVNSLI